LPLWRREVRGGSRSHAELLSLQLLDLPPHALLARRWPRPEGFRLLSGEADLTQYLFNSRKNQHYFCKHCGVRAFGVGTETPIGKMYGVNLGCLEGVSEEELARIPVTYVDGQHDRFAPPEFFSHL
jgi:hypothetical protein